MNFDPSQQDSSPNPVDAVNKSCAVIFAVVVVLLVLGGVGFWRYTTLGFTGSDLAEMRKRHIGPLLKKPKSGEEIWMVVPPSDRTASRRGKVAVVEFYTKEAGARIHPSMRELGDLQATPGHVDTVVFITAKTDVVGRYTNAAVAAQENFRLYCFDNKTGEYLGQQQVTGEKPPDRILVTEGAGVGKADVAGAIRKFPEAR